MKCARAAPSPLGATLQPGKVAQQAAAPICRCCMHLQAGGTYGTTLALTGNNSMAGGVTILNRVTVATP